MKIKINYKLWMGLFLIIGLVSYLWIMVYKVYWLYDFIWNAGGVITLEFSWLKFLAFVIINIVISGLVSYLISNKAKSKKKR